VIAGETKTSVKAASGSGERDVTFEIDLPSAGQVFVAVGSTTGRLRPLRWPRAKTVSGE